MTNFENVDYAPYKNFISDELVKAISLMESGKFEQGVDQLIVYRAANASTIGFRVVKDISN